MPQTPKAPDHPPRHDDPHPEHPRDQPTQQAPRDGLERNTGGFDSDVTLSDKELDERSQQRLDAALKQSMPTVADEQRERSDKMAAQGLEKWSEEHDERKPEDRVSKPVAGVVAPKEDPGNPRGDDRARTGRS
jgi:hypothetical protein